MRWAVLLALATTVVADDLPSLAEVVKIMAAREQASTPLWIEYDVSDIRRAGRFWSSGGAGWIYVDDEIVVRRLRTFEARHDADAFDRADHLEIDRIDVAGYRLKRPAGGADDAWTGRSVVGRRVLRSAAKYTPLHFGLVLEGEPASKLVSRSSARDDGREDVGAFHCRRLIVNRADAPHSLPVRIWLSPQHAYYPVKIEWYGSPKSKWRLAGDEFVFGGRTWAPRFAFVVDELVARGSAWIPVRAHCLMHDGRITLEANAKTVRVGPGIPSSLFRIDDVAYALVENWGGDGSEVALHSGPDAGDVVARTQDGRTIGLVREPVLSRAFWFYATAAVVLAAVVAFACRKALG